MSEVNLTGNIKGNVYSVGKTKQISDTFSIRELVLEVKDGEYVNHFKFEAVNDKVKLLDELSKGDTATVHFNLRGRKFTNKDGEEFVNNSLSIWKVSIDEVSFP